MASASQIRRRDSGEMEKGVAAEPQDERQTGGPGGRSYSAFNLPSAAALDTATGAGVKLLLEEAAEIRERQKADDDRLSDIKQALITIAAAHELKGICWGRIGLEYHGYKTKRTLDKELLLENGVDAQTIAASYRESTPFVSSRFVDIK